MCVLGAGRQRGREREAGSGGREERERGVDWERSWATMFDTLTVHSTRVYVYADAEQTSNGRSILNKSPSGRGASGLDLYFSIDGVLRTYQQLYCDAFGVNSSSSTSPVVLSKSALLPPACACFTISVFFLALETSSLVIYFY